MKIIRNLFMLFLLSFIFCLACTDDDTGGPILPPTDALTILNIGDSRVEGARPHFESYRYELWKNLVANNWDFDFIGPLADEAAYPAFMNQSFDPDHFGVGGAQTEDVLATIDETLAGYTDVDVVLMDIGGNDLLGNDNPVDVIANINQIIDILQAKNDSITIFIEQIAPGMTSIMTPQFIDRFNTFNELIAQIPGEQNTTTSTVVVVDMATGWSDDYLADNVHYNEAGAKIVADRYYASMESVLQN